ncbi:hypothetical protein C8F04DRAFT_1193103 [Mycena alexandri]|uniref:Uncharacterized protein n=1 Tax=Mycena alexandri TaxID=1745969 RepID=A0AAD6SBB1_9AGAR|nr:hypothetical protein C8F04DRAFT_1193103 [Mycena alexandri]
MQKQFLKGSADQRQCRARKRDGKRRGYGEQDCACRPCRFVRKARWQGARDGSCRGLAFGAWRSALGAETAGGSGQMLRGVGLTGHQPRSALWRASVGVAHRGGQERAVKERRSGPDLTKSPGELSKESPELLLQQTEEARPEEARRWHAWRAVAWSESPTSGHVPKARAVAGRRGWREDATRWWEE